MGIQGPSSNHLRCNYLFHMSEFFHIKDRKVARTKYKENTRTKHEKHWNSVTYNTGHGVDLTSFDRQKLCLAFIIDFLSH